LLVSFLALLPATEPQTKGAWGLFHKQNSTSCVIHGTRMSFFIPLTYFKGQISIKQITLCL
jgi:hypothetical protein